PSGLGHLQKGHGTAFADLDADGDLDVFAQMGGAFRSDLFHNACFENPGFGNRWLAVRLEGRQSNRSALGARIRAVIVEGGKQRSVYRTISSGGSFGANPLRAHLGLGQAEKIESLEVFWPKTGKTQVFRDVPLDRYLEIVEGEERFEAHELHPVKLGGGAR
ncbi:MAG TPA: ASPIC/UnbV domain-containing protein, partial [Planctomycetota bacterium]